MQNPDKELKAYLKILVHNLIFLNSILDQVNEFYNWLVKQGSSAINEGGWFYKVSLHSFKRILTIEACKLLSEGEQRSLKDWLQKAHQHGKSLKPTKYIPRKGYADLSLKEYRDLIETQIESLSELDELISNLKSLRDKGFAHADKMYFDNPEKLETDFLVTWDEFNLIFELMSEIVKKHYSLLFNADMSMHLTASGSIENILKHTRAFQRVWKNKILSEMGMKLYAFKVEEYHPDDIYLEGSDLEHYLIEKDK